MVTLWAILTAIIFVVIALAMLASFSTVGLFQLWSNDEHVSDSSPQLRDSSAAVYRSPPVSDLMDQLQWAELWFDTTPGETIPVHREHGLWLFRTVLNRINELQSVIDEAYEAKVPMLVLLNYKQRTQNDTPDADITGGRS